MTTQSGPAYRPKRPTVTNHAFLRTGLVQIAIQELLKPLELSSSSKRITSKHRIDSPYICNVFPISEHLSNKLCIPNGEVASDVTQLLDNPHSHIHRTIEGACSDVKREY